MGWVSSQKKKIMILRAFLSFVIATACTTVLFAQLTLRVTSIPINTPVDDHIYVAGNFNGWDPGSPDYILENVGGEVYELLINPDPGLLEFKFTRGGWTSVEGNANGGYLPNRTYNYQGGEETLELSILSWEGNGTVSTAADNVMILDEDFYMPQLNRERRIWIYLPPDYNESDKAYPVLYMHDGQNIFDVATSFSGEWEVDESLNELFDNGDEGIIVVAIDNGGEERINEYSPWVNPQYGGGEGDEYINFIVDNLKPYIDESFRTLPEREHTGIMGSSLGGLISMYAAIEHQDVFSKAGIFSASFWFSDQSYMHVANTGKQEDMKIYLIAGAQEGSGGGQVEDMFAMYNTLLNAGFSEDELVALAHPDGQHSEWYWAREFPDAYEYLYSVATSSDFTSAYASLPSINIYPNPGKELMYIESEGIEGELTYELVAMNGGVVVSKQALSHKQTIPLISLNSGTYLLLIYSNDVLFACKKIRKQ
jgi:predicted alpha/beta superfamily hydrolase